MEAFMRSDNTAELELELNPSPNCAVAALVTKIANVLEDETFDLQMSVLFSALLRLASASCDGNTREAAMKLARLLKDLGEN
jgi:hypothetical protein